MVALAHRIAFFGVAMKNSIIAWAALAAIASACARDSAKAAKAQLREQNAPTQAAAMPPAHDALPNTAGFRLGIPLRRVARRRRGGGAVTT